MNGELKEPTSPRRISRREFLKLAVATTATALLATACTEKGVSVTKKLPEKPVKAKTPEPTPTKFDYCLIQEGSDEASRLTAGTPVPKELIFPGDLEKIRSLPITRKDIIPLENKGLNNIILVPVGYSDSDTDKARYRKRMNDFRDIGGRVFQELGLSFLYLDFSVPVGIEESARLANFSSGEEAQTLWVKIQEVIPIKGQSSF